MAKLSDSNIYFRKNLLINGAMKIHQRDNSQSGIGNGDGGYHTLDRWKFVESGSPGAVWTQSQNTLVVPAGTGFLSSLKMVCTTTEAAVAADEVNLIEQRVEAQDCQHLLWGETDARDVTLSFWLYSTKAGTMGVSLVVDDAGTHYIQEITITADTWEKHELTFPGTTSSTINDDIGIGIRVCWCLFGGTDYQNTADTWGAGTDFTTSNQTNFADSTDNNIYITGTQLELGSKATEFEWRPLSVELKLCERYFEKSYNLDSNVASNPNYSGSWGVTPCRSGTDYREDVRFRTRKRAAPTLTFYSPENGTSGKIRNVTAGSNVTFAIVDIGETGAADHNWGSATVDGNRYQAHYTADAEL
jgi:hypothetical protein